MSTQSQSTSTECPTCGRTDFKSEAGMKVHHASVHGESLAKETFICGYCGIEFERYACWTKDDTDQEYCSHKCEGKDYYEKSDDFNLAKDWKREGKFNPVYLKTDAQGYEVISNTYKGKRDRFKHHRLLAVAEFGFEAIKDKVIHHKNNHRWDNRPANIEPMTHSEHAQTHGVWDNLDTPVNEKVTPEFCQQLRRESEGKTHTELGEKYGLYRKTVGEHVRGDCHHER